MRHCHKCGRAIEGCFSFVKAGDFIEVLEGQKERAEVRETCAVCVEAVSPETDKQIEAFRGQPHVA